MFAVPSNDTPPIVRAVSNAVAVAAFPVVSPTDETTRSIVPSLSSYVAAMPVSVLPVNIAPTMSCTCSVLS